MERLIDPAIADLQHEHDDAMRRGLIWRSRWIRLAGYAAVVKLTAIASLDRALHDRSREDDRTVGRTIIFSLIATTVLTGALLWPPLHDLRQPGAVTVTWLFPYLLPQALSVALPFGLVFGIVLGLRDRVASSRVRSTIASLAVVGSVLAFVMLAWVLPAANQTFRELIVGGPTVRGLNELTIGQLASRNVHLGNPTRMGFEFHFRVALAFAPLALGLFSISLATVRRKPRGAVAACLTALAASFAYYTLLYWAHQVEYVADWFSPVVSGWAPNVVCVSVALLLRRVRRERFWELV